MKFYLLSFIIFLFINNSYYNNLLSQDLYINEMMSANQKFYFDEDGDVSDWIELYNSSDNTILLKDYFLSDNPNNLFKWQFPNVDIKSEEYLIIFCSNKDRKLFKSRLHTNFAINNEGETLYLSKNKEIIDSIAPIKLKANQSYGVINRASFQYEIFLKPTPGSVNIQNPKLNEVLFSHSTGIYPVSFNLKLELKNKEPNHKIRYTIDGSKPNANSEIYEFPLYLDENLYNSKSLYKIQIAPDYLHFEPNTEIPKCIIVKSAVFDENNELLSEIKSNTFIIINELNKFTELNNQKSNFNFNQLPVISISADSIDLFDDERGILVRGNSFIEDDYNNSGNYFNRGKEWEREAFFDFIDTNGNKLSQKIGLRIHGNSTRKFSQKSFRLYARSEFGNNFFDYNFFPEINNKYKRLIIKSFNKGWGQNGYNDFISKSFAKNLDIDYSHLRSCLMFLNGEFWGIYYLQERLDDEYFLHNKGINKDSIEFVIAWDGYTGEGGNEDFIDLYNFINENDLKDIQNFEYVENKLDLNNYIDYLLLNIFVGNIDWPLHNIECWREKKPNSKWSFMFNDGDATFLDVYHNSIENLFNTSDTIFANNYSSTLFFRKLIQNDIFFNKFISRFEYLINNEFNYANTKQHLNFITQKLEPVIRLQIDRYNYPIDYYNWNYSNNLIDSFLINRNCILTKYFNNIFENRQISYNCNNSGNPIDSINNINDNQLIIKTQIFPNPSADYITIYSNCINNNFNLVESYNVEIIDILGQIVYSENFEINYKNSFIQTINISHLSKGQYFFKLNTKMKPNEIINQNDNNSPINSHKYFSKFIKN